MEHLEEEAEGPGGPHQRTSFLSYISDPAGFSAAVPDPESLWVALGPTTTQSQGLELPGDARVFPKVVSGLSSLVGVTKATRKRRPNESASKSEHSI